MPCAHRWAGKVTIDEISIAADGGPKLAEASITIAGALTLRFIKVMAGQRGQPWTAYPARKIDEEWIHSVEVLDTDLAAEIKSVVVAAYARYAGDGDEALTGPDEGEEDAPW